MKVKKIISILLVFLILLNYMQGVVKAFELDSAYIEDLGDCGFHLQYKKQSTGEWRYIITTLAGFRDSNNQLHYAYCLSPDRNGVGEEDNYTVNITDKLSDARIWRAIINGFPYKSASELGVETNEDAFVATKQAVYCVLLNRDIDSFYRGGDERGNKIVGAIKNIVNIANNGTQTPENNSLLNIGKVGNLKVDNNNYYSQEYSVSSSIEMSDYTITGFNNFPEGSFVADMSNNARNNFSAGEHFKVLVPKDKIVNNVTGKITATGNVKSYPIFYGQSPSVNLQDYALTYDAYTTASGEADLSIDGFKSKLQIIKTDSETGNRISGVTFNARYQDGTNIGDFTTNNEGIINITNLKQGKVIVKETKTNNEYILDDSEKEVVLKYDEMTGITVTNDHKEGDLKIIKVDKDDNDLTLGAVEFDVIDSSGNVVRHLVTDVNGVAEAKKLRTGTYTLRETLTKKEYKLALDKDVTIEWNKTFELKFENEKRKGKIKIVKIDSDYNEVKLENVEFQVIDKNNHIVETVKTNKEGIATTSNLPIGDYKIKESSLGTNEEYILSEELKTITVEEDKIKTIQFENDHKKGNLEIYKVDLDNNKIPVPDVEFEITDNDGYKYYAKSDDKGKAFIENIRTGIATIKETKTNKIYKLSDETYSAEIKWNETAKITIKNEKLKGQVEVFKIDAENNEIKLEGVEFQVINSNDEVVETIKTNKEGYAITSRIPIGEYRLKEVKTDSMHILNKEIIKVDVTTDIISKLNITNERIKGQIKIVKTSKDDNFINGTKAGTPIKNVKFEVYDSNKKKVDEIITGDDGIAITKKLDKGSYTIKEVQAGEWYLLNENEFATKITKHGEIVEIDVTNDSESPKVDIEKTGIIQTTANQEIRYDFKIKNTGNVPLSNFTWYDYLPIDYVRITKLVTGTYNQDLNYSIYYKTNLNDYRLLKENLNTKINNYIDFSNIELAEGEFVTDFKVDFGTVDVGFESVENPYIFVTVNNTVKNDDSFTNKTRIEGDNKGYLVWDEDDHTTNVYSKKINVKLPKTGF